MTFKCVKLLLSLITRNLKKREFKPIQLDSRNPRMLIRTRDQNMTIGAVHNEHKTVMTGMTGALSR